MTKIKAIYINLPIKDIAQTRAFWTNLGFTFNEQFSDDKALCLVLNDGIINAMLMLPEFYKTFTNRPVATGNTTQVLLAIEVESRAKVDEIVQRALANGAQRYREAEDHGWMYYDSFADIDGHQWEVLFSDETLLPKE